jgi:hypothetical protein
MVELHMRSSFNPFWLCCFILLWRIGYFCHFSLKNESFAFYWYVSSQWLLSWLSSQSWVGLNVECSNYMKEVLSTIFSFSFKMKVVLFRTKVKPCIFGCWCLVISSFLLKWSLHPSGWRLSPIFLCICHSWSFLRFHLKRSVRPSRRRSFEMKSTSFWMKVFWNEG